MTADEPLGQFAQRLARCMDAIAMQSTIYNGLDRINAKDAAATLRALATANEALVKARDAAIRERDAAREEGYRAGWADREGDLLAGIERVCGSAGQEGDAP